MRFVIICFLFLMILPQANSALGNDELDVTVEDLANLRDIGGHTRGAINVSPDGRWVVFQLQTPKISKGDYELMWMSLSTDSGKVFRIADGGDVHLNPTLSPYINGNIPPAQAKWAPDSKSFVHLVRRNGQTQLWRSRPDRKGKVQLTHNAGDVIDFSWSPDGTKIHFTVGLEKAQNETLSKVEGERGFHYDDRFVPWKSAKPIQHNCGESYDRFVVFSLNRACEPTLWTFELKSKRERFATEKEKESFNELKDDVPLPKVLKDRSFKRLRRSADGKKFAWLENTSPETYPGPYAPLTIFAFVDGTVHQCNEEACRAYDISGQDMWWREDSQEVILLRRDGPSRSLTGLYGWVPSTGGLRRILQTDDWLSDCGYTDDRLICLYESWTQPRKIVSVSLDNGTIKGLYDPNPNFARKRFSKVEKLEWNDSYGNPTHGHLVYPIDYQAGRVYPLVIVTYQSRGFLRGGVGNEYPIFALAAESFFVLSQEMPFDTDSVAKSANPNDKLFENQYLRKSVLSSQEIIVKRLVEAGLIDKARVAITGLSEGQSQVAYALIHSDIISAGIASGAWGSPSSYYLAGDLARKFERSIWGSPNNPESLEEALSLGLNADRVNAPLLVNVSDDELLGAVENIARLKEAGKPVEMYVYPDEYHIKWQPQHRLAIYRRNVQWLKFWLKGEMEPDPVSPGQYERWIDLCKRHVENMESKANSNASACVRGGSDTAPWQ